jgi:hypothetical protein
VSGMSHSDSDQDLIRLFAETHPFVPAEEFVTNVMTRIGRERQRRTGRKLTLGLLLAALAAAATPYVAEGSLAAGTRFYDGLVAFGAALGSPAGWVCSLAVGAWALSRAWIIGRR